MTICDYQECTGCFACMNICVHNAITVTTDEFGKTIPKVNDNLCVGCGVCRKVCPINNPVEQVIPSHVYAAWSKLPIDVELSSSGGMASVLSRWILKQGGVVFGASSEGKSVRHVAIKNEKDIEKIRGSKYVQSEIQYSFREVKTEVEKRKPVLFSGTPCQIAGLKNYLRKDYANLYTVDLICHGTPPTEYLTSHLRAVLPTNTDWNHVSFRGKYNFILTAYLDDKIVYQESKDMDTYYKAFFDGLIFRDNCYQCHYAFPERVSDITVADFWGIDRSKMEHPYDGRISLVLVNTEKGKQLFEQCCDDFIYEEHTLEEAMSPEQTNLHHPSVPHKDREIFEKAYRLKGFEKAVRKTEIGKIIRKRKARLFLKSILVKIGVIKK